MSVLRLLTVYNEKDIIRENILYYISQGIETVVLDNCSKDGTYEILKEFEGKGVRWIERVKTDFYDIIKINTLLLNLALKYEKEDYFLWVDADELICPFDSKYKLEYIIPKLFNKFTVKAFGASKVEFYLTENDDVHNGFDSFNNLKFFYFEPYWKDPIFKREENLKTYIDKPFYLREDQKELPYKKLKNLFYIKHYPFRSIRQAKKKIYRGIPKNMRNSENPNKNFLNYHYLCYREELENKIVRNANELNEFKDTSDFFVKFMCAGNPRLQTFYQKIYKLLDK